MCLPSSPGLGAREATHKEKPELLSGRRKHAGTQALRSTPAQKAEVANPPRPHGREGSPEAGHHIPSKGEEMDIRLLLLMGAAALLVIGGFIVSLLTRQSGGQLLISGVGSFGRNAIPEYVRALKRHRGGASSILGVGLVDDNLGTNTPGRNARLKRLVPRGRLYLPKSSMIKNPFGYRGSFLNAIAEMASWRPLTQGMNDFLVGLADRKEQLSPMEISFLGYTGGHLGPHITTILERFLRLRTIIRVLVVALSEEQIRQKDMTRDSLLFRRLWETGVVTTTVFIDNNEAAGEPDETRAARDEFVWDALSAFQLGPTQLTGQTTPADVFEKVGRFSAMSHGAEHIPVIPGKEVSGTHQLSASQIPREYPSHPKPASSTYRP